MEVTKNMSVDMKQLKKGMRVETRFGDATIHLVENNSIQLLRDDKERGGGEHVEDYGSAFIVNLNDIVSIIGGGNTKPDDMVRYMIYGHGCSNKGSVHFTEKDMIEDLRKNAKDDDWEGRIIGYKMVPICEAEVKIICKKFISPKVKRKR